MVAHTWPIINFGNSVLNKLCVDKTLVYCFKWAFSSIITSWSVFISTARVFISKNVFLSPIVLNSKLILVNQEFKFSTQLICAETAFTYIAHVWVRARVCDGGGGIDSFVRSLACLFVHLWWWISQRQAKFRFGFGSFFFISLRFALSLYFTPFAAQKKEITFSFSH